MFQPMLLVDGISGLNRRMGFRKSARRNRRPRRDNRFSDVAAEVLRLEERCLMSNTDALVPMPDAYYKGDPNQVVWEDPSVPIKTITLTNNTDHTIFPILRDPNDVKGAGQGTGSYYDPKDAFQQDYRGYVGYATGGKNYLGLPPGDSITITVPLVFWNGARVFIATDPSFITNHLKEGAPNINNPFQYYEFENDGTPRLRRIDTEGKLSGNDPSFVGKVMWYHAKEGATPGSIAQASE